MNFFKVRNIRISRPCICKKLIKRCGTNYLAGMTGLTTKTITFWLIKSLINQYMTLTVTSYQHCVKTELNELDYHPRFKRWKHEHFCCVHIWITNIATKKKEQWRHEYASDKIRHRVRTLVAMLVIISINNETKALTHLGI